MPGFGVPTVDLGLPPKPTTVAGMSVLLSDGVDWQEWRRPGPTREQRWRDLWLGLAIMAIAMLSAVLVNSLGAFTYGEAPPLPEQLAWAVALTIPLIWRRQFPVVVVLVVGALFIAAQARHNGDNLLPSIALFMALYALGAWGQNRVVARWVRIGVIAAMFTWLAISFGQWLLTPVPAFENAAGPLDPVLAMVLYQVGMNLFFFLLGYYFGNVAWLSARRNHELVLRADQLRQSREENARQAVVAERVRIARDLHDVVAHHVAVMGVQAGAARRVVDTDRELAGQALTTVEGTARTAIAELRGLLGVLRSDADERPASERTPELQPASPGMDQLRELVAETEAAGVRVGYAVFGTARTIPDSVALSAYRVAQEALTNVVKHAGVTRADLRVRYLESALEIEVSDEGMSRARTGTSDGAGLGLVGMRERVAVHDGTLEAGPRAGGGFRVRASFPLDVPADRTDSSMEATA